MIPLRMKGIAQGVYGSIVGVLTDQIDEKRKILLWDGERSLPSDMDMIGILTDKVNVTVKEQLPRVIAMKRLNHLTAGDIVAMHESGLVETLFRVDSPHNSLFITDRCNSNCLMCSQPPRNRDDLDALFHLNSRLIPLIPKGTRELGITGGEPTLLGKRLPELISMTRDHLPQTALHMLTNGRSFAWPEVVTAYAQINHQDLVFGIPLYSDYYAQHDYIVQAKDAFWQTVMGLYNLAKYRQRVEIRVVLHRQSLSRLVPLARFIYKNLPFAEHVAFMGLEYTGYTPHNDHLLFMEPDAYMDKLEEAVCYLDDMGMCVSLYNLPMCLVPSQLHGYCRKSISDWKQGYLEECIGCAALEQCGGVFLTSRKHSSNIRAIEIGVEV